jgi:hypothetical protein
VSEFTYELFCEYVEMCRNAPPMGPPVMFPWQVALCERYGITVDDLEAMGFNLIDPADSADQ